MSYQIRKYIAAVVLFVMLLAVWALAQSQPKPPTGLLVSSPAGSNPIAGSRQPGGGTAIPNPIWAAAGATIVNRTTVCYTDTGALDTVAQIVSAISGCNNTNQVVQLQAGTYNLTNGLDLNGFRNVTLRGQGASSTKLVFTGATGCNFSAGAAICIRSGENVYGPNGSGFNTASWSGPYTIGTNSVVLSSKTGLQVGQILMLDQADDASDGWPSTGDLYVCAHTATCSANVGGTNFTRPGRNQTHVVTVTSIEAGTCAPSCHIGISPALVAPNWRAGQSPGAWWGNTLVPTGVGVENLSIDVSASGSPPIMFFNVTNSWIKGVRAVENSSPPSTFSQVRIMNANRITIRDSYFVGPFSQTQDTYGLTCELCSGVLIENNIMGCNPGGFEHNGPDQGSVWAYNYGETGCSWANTIISHNAGVMMVLYEGNTGSGMTSDIIHGTEQIQTQFRNAWFGGTVGQTGNTVQWIQSRHRFFNVIGNVMGGSATTYERNVVNSNGSEIYSLGDNYSSPVATDPSVKTRLYRWGNWDIVTSTNDNGTNDQTGVKWDSLEVPAGLTTFSQTVPATHTLPSSLYLTTKPAFFGSGVWPGIGPDVTNGDITNAGGHAFKNPARLCREAMADDPGYSGTAIRIFSTASCPYLGL